MSNFFEPWQIYPETEQDLLGVMDCNRKLVCDFMNASFGHNLDALFARRIVACVNALAGIPTEHVEKMQPERWLGLVREASAEPSVDQAEAFNRHADWWLGAHGALLPDVDAAMVRAAIASGWNAGCEFGRGAKAEAEVTRCGERFVVLGMSVACSAQKGHAGGHVHLVGGAE